MDHATKADLHAVKTDIGGRLNTMDGRFDKIDGRLDKIDGRLVILERIESSVRFIAENMTAKASTTEMKADERLSGRVSLLEDVARQHSEDIRLLRAGSK